MRDDLLLKLQRIIEGKDRITWELFPAIYEGFLEADELSLAEDRMLRLIAEAVQTCTNDKVISTASSDKVAEYEDAFGLPSEGFTLEQRRQNVIDYINRSRVFNEVTLHELVLSLSDDEDVHERVDCENLTLGVFSEDEDGRIDTRIIDGIRAIVPQNLALYSGTDTTFSRPIVVNHANFSALSCGLGLVEKIEPPLMGYIVLNSETGTILGAAKGHELETVPILACTIASPEIECVPIPARVLESPEMIVYVPTVVELPEVTEIWTLPNSSSGISTIQSGDANVLWESTTPREQIPYDVTSCYAVVFWRKSDNTLGGRTEFSLEGISNVLAARNVSSSTIEVYWIKVAVCSPNQAAVVHVYDSSNNAYNAFKFTANNTDYYYVLDGTQTDWADDLSSIGYSLEPEPDPDYLDIFFYYNSGTSVTFGANDYWGSRIIDNEDKLTLESFGITIDSYHAQEYGYMVARSNLDNFTFTPIGLYSGLRTGDLNADMSNFYCGTYGSSPGSLYYGVCIRNYAAYNTSTLTWKCRITRINGGN